MSPAEIKEAVAGVIVVNKDLLLEERYRVNGKRKLFLLYTGGYIFQHSDCGPCLFEWDDFFTL